jgi:vanillate O-demethylase monooxygenase subunit
MFLVALSAEMHTSDRPTEHAIEAYCRGLERFWHAVARASDVDSHPLPVQLLGRHLVVARLDGRLVALDDVCRHLGASLSIGEIVDGGAHLQCRYHGWTYDAGGRVVDIPARRGVPIPREARVAAYRCQEAYGLVWVCLAQEPAAPVPDYPEHADPRWRKTPIRSYPAWSASAPRIVMAALDDTHFPWVHPGVLGDPEHPEPPEHRAWVEGDHLEATYTIMQPANISIGSAAGEQGLEEVRYTNYATPSTIRLLKEAPGGDFVIWHAVCPSAYDRSLLFLQVARTFDIDPAQDEKYLEFEDLIQSQDRPVVESQRPWLLPPLSSRLMLYVRPADLPLIVYQKWMEELGIPQI